jgi:deoxyribodipyrimidine photo-lyase
MDHDLTVAGHSRPTGAPALLWLRRDLRRADHPALGAAAGEGGPVLPVFVIDPAFWDDAGAVRRGWLAATLLATRDAYGRLCLLRGDPRRVLPEVATWVGATSVHVSTETEPGGHARDLAVAEALAEHGVSCVETGSPYAVTPGRVRTGQGTPFKVFTPFSKGWRTHGWRGPAAEPVGVRLIEHDSDPGAWALVEEARRACPITLPPAGERAASERWHEFLDASLAGYDTDRDRPDLDATSRLSPYLKFGVVHPRTLLADLDGRSDAASGRFVTELAWREFYADVLWHNPHTLSHDLRPELAGLAYDEPDVRFDAWRAGLTGYPIVDAGMRQLLAEGWMHNRVRMITASFLTKDLHLWWPLGARHFLDHLIDGDLASNAHGWQWTAGTGTDASPYFRVFNPITQGDRFDPSGDYVRRWVPELAHLRGAVVHRPWTQASGHARGYPKPIVDHAAERLVALDRYARRGGPDATGGQ